MPRRIVIDVSGVPNLEVVLGDDDIIEVRDAETGDAFIGITCLGGDLEAGTWDPEDGEWTQLWHERYA